MPIENFEAICLQKGFQGEGTKNHLVLEILCSKDGNQIKALAREYEILTGQKLVEKLRTERVLSRHMTTLLVALASGSRDTSNLVDTEKANAQAFNLYKDGIGRFGTHEETFIEILTECNFKQIQEVSRIYGKNNQLNLRAAIIKEMSGYLEVGLCTICKFFFVSLRRLFELKKYLK